MAAADRAADSLRVMILSGRVAAGARLGEVELASELGMSRTPVREALRRLAAEGLVEVAAGRGARVSEWSTYELEHVFELRARLEGLAAREAADRSTVEEMDALDDLARQIEGHAEPGPGQDLDRVAELNTRFHGEIVRIAGSTSLRTALSGVVHAAIMTRTQEAFDVPALRRSVNHHLEIVAALRAGDPDWAESTMRSHLLSARASLLGPRRSAAVTDTHTNGGTP